MYYGIELETIATRTPRNGVGTHRELGEVLSEIDSELWLAGHDGSIGNYGDGESGIEFKTAPVDCCPRELNRLADTMPQVMETFGCRVNATCGTHISHSTGVEYTPIEAQRLGYFGKMFQQAFYACTGSSGRETNSYCAKLSDYPIFSDKEHLNADGAQWGRIERQNWLNITHLQRGNARTVSEGTRVEFRVFSATTQVNRIIAWTNLSHSFMRFCESKSTRVSAPSFTRAGIGRASLEALLDTLAYTRRANDCWIDNDTITKCEGISILRDLADKYDSKRLANGAERVI